MTFIVLHSKWNYTSNDIWHVGTKILVGCGITVHGVTLPCISVAKDLHCDLALLWRSTFESSIPCLAAIRCHWEVCPQGSLVTDVKGFHSLLPPMFNMAAPQGWKKSTFTLWICLFYFLAMHQSPWNCSSVELVCMHDKVHLVHNGNRGCLLWILIAETTETLRKKISVIFLLLFNLCYKISVILINIFYSYFLFTCLSP